MSYSCPESLRPDWWDILTGDIHNCAGGTYDHFTFIFWALFATIALFWAVALWPKRKGGPKE